MKNLIIIFILGLSVMFFGMTTWLFFRKGGRLSFIVASLMALLGVQCFISVWFILENIYFDEYYWKILTSIDIVAVPFYALILRELVRPGSVTWKIGVANVFPFAFVAFWFLLADYMLIYWIMIFGAFVYGTVYLIWTHINIGIYNRKLKEQFSFTENINLSWLRMILWFFFVLLGIWIADTLLIQANMECFYLVLSVVMWMVIDFFLYKHETVMNDLNTSSADVANNCADDAAVSELGLRIERLFTDEQIFLNPNLKISDVAGFVGTNRTYVSNYFNREVSTTFYDYVNGLRVEYACRLLLDTDQSVKVIAQMSGYNSPQTFIRVFSKIKGVLPSDFRKIANI